MGIDEIINKKYSTKKGLLYFVDLLKEKYPSLKINESALATLKVEKMSQKNFLRTGFSGIYIAQSNTIKVFTNLDKNGNKIYDYNLSEEELLNTVLHELIHALTSVIKDDGTVLEGINMRSKEGINSILIAINEGITQMLTDDLLNHSPNAYPFETNFARQLSYIIGSERLMEIYSLNDPELLLKELETISPGINIFHLFKLMYVFHLFTKGSLDYLPEGLGDQIQQMIIDIYKASNLNKNPEFRNVILDSKKVYEYSHLLPIKLFNPTQQLGFNNIDKIKMSLNGIIL